MQTTLMSNNTIVFNDTEIVYEWKPYTDSVVGGTSTASIYQKEDHISFQGVITAISHASWASLRSNLVPKDLSSYSGVELTLRTDGRPYAFEIEYNLAWQDAKASFIMQPVANEWITFKIPFANFHTVQLNKIISDKAAIESFSNVKRFNFHVAKKIVGDFRLDIKSVSFY